MSGELIRRVIYLINEMISPAFLSNASGEAFETSKKQLISDLREELAKPDDAMTEKRAREILQEEYIGDDGKVYADSMEVQDLTADELEAIAFMMRLKEAK